MMLEIGVGATLNVNCEVFGRAVSLSVLSASLTLVILLLVAFGLCAALKRNCASSKASKVAQQESSGVLLLLRCWW